MNYVLITRKCKCPCKREFKILETSKCEWYSANCNPEYKHKQIEQSDWVRVKAQAKRYYGDLPPEEN